MLWEMKIEPILSSYNNTKIGGDAYEWKTLRYHRRAADVIPLGI